MSTRPEMRHPERHPAPGVVLSYLHPGETAGRFTESLVHLLFHDAGSERSHIVSETGGHIAVQTGPRLAEARTQICMAFLTDKAIAGAEFLLMLDSDMTFDGDLVERLVASAQRHNADVMGGLCFAGRPGKQWPTIYRLVEDGGIEMVPDYPHDQVVKVGATGGACILIRRRILERMMATFGRTPEGRVNPYPFFSESFDRQGRPWGEDTSFCLRVGALDGGVYVDTSVKLGHVKHFELTEDTYFAEGP